MTWTRLSDNYADRPELLNASRSARHLLTELLVYGNRMLTDGLVPAAALSRVTDSPDPDGDIAELVCAGVVEVRPDGSIQVDWSDQEPAADVRERQRGRAVKQKRYRDRKSKHASGDHESCDPRYCSSVTRHVMRNEPRNVTGLVTPSRPGPARRSRGGEGALQRCSNGSPIAPDGSCCGEPHSSLEESA